MVFIAIAYARIVSKEAWGRFSCTYLIQGLGTEKSRIPNNWYQSPRIGFCLLDLL